MRIPIEQIATSFGQTVQGTTSGEILSIDPISEARPGSATWVKEYSPKTIEVLRSLCGALVVAPPPQTAEERALVDSLSERNAVLVTEAPRMLFARMLKLFFAHLGVQIAPGIDPSAQIHGSAKLGEDVTVGAFSFVGPEVEIGDGTVLHPGVVVHSHTTIGRHCIIDSKATIGTRGFGYVPDEDGTLFHFPQLGRVILEDYVEVHAGSTVARPGLGTTRVGRGTKIDCLCHIGHNAQIGRNCIITACSEIGAGVVVEEGAWIGPNTCCIENITLGKGCLVGIGSTVVRSVEPGAVVAGNPSEPMEKIKRSRKAIKRLLEER